MLPEKKIWLVVQARLGSTRLPGKALIDFGPGPILTFLLRRLKTFDRPHTIVLATTTNPEDSALLRVADSIGVNSFAGPIDDVLARFIEALSDASDEDSVVRLTGDNPFVDLKILDRMIHTHVISRADYTSPTGCALGLGAEVVRMSALRAASSSTSRPWHREHVTPFIKEHPEIFRLSTVAIEPDRSAYRLTIDTEEDLLVARGLTEKLSDRIWLAEQEDLISCLDSNPALRALNEGVRQKGIED